MPTIVPAPVPPGIKNILKLPSDSRTSFTTPDFNYIPSVIESLDTDIEPRLWYRQSGKESRSDITALQACCGNCYEQGHEVGVCRQARADGYVHGCFWCNHPNHLSSACESLARKDKNDQAYKNNMLFIAIKARSCIASLLLHFPFTNIPGFDRIDPKLRPWTPDFAKVNCYR